MALLKAHKFVNALPTELEPDALYIVRSGAGFDLYVTNHSGLVAAYPLNAPDSASGYFRTEPITAAASGQTSFTVPGGYTPGAIFVSLNGASLPPADFTATDGTTVVLASGAGIVSGSVLLVHVLSAFEVANALPIGGTAADSSKLGGQIPSHFLDFANRTGAPAAVAFASVDLLVPDGTLTDLSFDTVVFDNANCLNLATSNKLLTVPKTGLYLLWCSSDFEGGAGVSGIANTRVSLANGSPYLLVSSPYSSIGCQMSGSGLAYLTAGDQLKMSVFQLTGSAKHCRGFLWANRFGIARVG